MRQYRIITKTPTTDATPLEPGVHASLYNIPEVRAAVAFVRENVNVEMVGIRIDSRLFSIIVVRGDELQDNCFELKDD